jgi:hypothetical protein
MEIAMPCGASVQAMLLALETARELEDFAPSGCIVDIGAPPVQRTLDPKDEGDCDRAGR